MIKQFLCYLFLICFFNGYSQTTIGGNVYNDTTMTTNISNVKIVFKSIKSKKCIHVKTDENGYFKFSIEELETEYKVTIKKKNYIPIIIESFSLQEKYSDLYLKIIMKRMLSVHDKDYDGLSKVILIEKK